MTILSNLNLLDYTYSQTLSKLKSFIDPNNGTYSIDTFADIIETIDISVRELARTLLEEALESMDDVFFHSAQRKRDYKVKAKRPRTLITMFGSITVTRRIYQSKSTGKCFTYVDRKLGLPRYDRYDPAVKARIIEAYADHNSMIKVGQIIGELINATFSRNPNRKLSRISRQTVHNIVKGVHKLSPTFDRRTVTPDTLYLMADEKFINLQRGDKDRAMVKHSLLFEGFEKKEKRTVLTNKMTFTSCETDFWESINDVLAQIYDMNKVKQIVIMGDGAPWLKTGARESPYATFILDKFHTFQAMNAMTRDESLRYNLREAIIKDDIVTFKQLIQVLNLNHQDEPKRLETIASKAKYIIKHGKAIQFAHHQSMLGSSMEAHISHNLASVFSSRPKAYGLKNLEVYLSTRNLHLNNIDIVNTYLKTFHYPKSHKVQPIEKEVLDFSMFDPRPSYDKSSHSLWLKGFISKQ